MTTPSDELRAKAFNSLAEMPTDELVVKLSDALATLERAPVAYPSNIADFDALWQVADAAENAAPVHTEDEVRKLAWLWWSRGRKGEPVAEAVSFGFLDFGGKRRVISVFGQEDAIKALQSMTTGPVADAEIAKLIQRARRLVARQPDDITQLLADALEREHAVRLLAGPKAVLLDQYRRNLAEYVSRRATDLGQIAVLEAQLAERDQRIAELTKRTCNACPLCRGEIGVVAVSVADRKRAERFPDLMA